MLNFKKIDTLKSFLTLFLSTILFSNNLIYFFISWVGLNISLYSVLLGAGTIHNKKNVGPSEVTLKYFIVGAMLTTFFLFSMVLFAVNYLTFDHTTISYYLLKGMESSTLHLSLSEKTFYLMIVALLLFKLGAFPFHFYLRDIYLILCPLNNMFVYTVTLKVFIFLTLISVLSDFWFLAELFYPLIAVSAIGSIVSGAFGAMTQQKFKAFLAYSYLNSLGFVLLAVSSGISYGFGALTFYSAYVYFASYLLAWMTIVVILGLHTRTARLVNVVGENPEMYYIDHLLTLDLTGAYSVENWQKHGVKSGVNGGILIAGLLVSFSSLLGLPPTFGFYAKALVYFGLVGSGFGQFLLILALVFTPLMAYSYLRLVIKLVYPLIVEEFISVNSRQLVGQFPLQIFLTWISYRITPSTIKVIILSLLTLFIPTLVFYEDFVI